MILRELVHKLGFQYDENKIKAFERNIQNVSKKVEQVGTKLRNVGAGFTAFATLPIVAGLTKATSAAIDAQETYSKFDVVFSNLSSQAESAANTLRDSFGLSRQQAKGLLGDTGDLLSGFGFTQEKALELSSAVQELAVDLASFTNYSGGAEGASKALTKALLGERESVKSLGIAILEEDVKKEIAIMKSKGMRFETERQAKAEATLQIAMRQSKNAIGDYARTKDSLANRIRTTRNRIQDLAETFGNIMIPYVEKALNVIDKMIKKFESFSPATKKIIIALGLFVAAIGPVLIVIGQMAIGLSGLIALAGTLAGIKWASVLSLGVWGLIAAAIAVVILLVEDFIGYMSGKEAAINWDKFINRIKNSFKTAVNWMIDKWNRFTSLLGLDSLKISPIFDDSVFAEKKTLKGSLKGASEERLKRAMEVNEQMKNINAKGGFIAPGFQGSSKMNGTTMNQKVDLTINAAPGTDIEAVKKSVKEGLESANSRFMREANLYAVKTGEVT